MAAQTLPRGSEKLRCIAEWIVAEIKAMTELLHLRDTCVVWCFHNR